MQRELMRRVIQEGESDCIVVFCVKQYQGYEIGGSVRRVHAFFHLDQTCIGHVAYLMVILFLVRPENLRKRGSQRTYDLSRSGLPMLVRPGIDEAAAVDLNELGITDNRYLQHAVKAQQEIIVAEIDLVIDEVKTFSSRVNLVNSDGLRIADNDYPPGVAEDRGRTLKNHLERIYVIPAFYAPGGPGRLVPYLENVKIDCPRREYLDTVLSDTWEKLSLEYEYHHMSREAYRGLLHSIGDLARKWIEKEKLAIQDIRLLNRLYDGAGDRTYPLTNFCWKFFDDLVDDLTTQKEVVKCPFCGDFFKYTSRHPKKKFCSRKTEGKDCEKKARNRRYYKKHREEIAAKAKKYAKERRKGRKESGPRT